MHAAATLDFAQRARDDLLEHGAGLATLGRPVGVPDRRVVLGEDVLEVAVALHAARRELGDVDVARPVVAMLDQQPGPAVALARSIAEGAPIGIRQAKAAIRGAQLRAESESRAQRLAVTLEAARAELTRAQRLRPEDVG